MSAQGRRPPLALDRPAPQQAPQQAAGPGQDARAAERDEPQGDHVTRRTERRTQPGTIPEFRSVLVISVGGRVTRQATQWLPLDRFTSELAVQRGLERDALLRWMGPGA